MGGFLARKFEFRVRVCCFADCSRFGVLSGVMSSLFGSMVLRQFMTVAPVAFFFLFLFIAIGAAWYRTHQLKKRAEAFMLFAVQNGFEFRNWLNSESGGMFEQMYAKVMNTQNFLGQYNGFQPIFNQNAQVRFIFDGASERMPFQAFQYQYTSSSGKNRKTHYFMIASLIIPAWMPELSVSKEDILDKIGKTFGGQDIQFESEDFNRMFRVRGSSEKIAHDVMHPQMMEWFMHVQPPGFQMRDHRVVLWRSGELTTDFVMDSRAMFQQFWDLIPDYVKEEGRM